jgi:hypothetical protein
MACGCQVVGYGDFTKWQAKPFDIKSIAEQVINCWEEIKDRKEEARKESRQWIIENANMEKQVKEKYINFYKINNWCQESDRVGLGLSTCRPDGRHLRTRIRLLPNLCNGLYHKTQLNHPHLRNLLMDMRFLLMKYGYLLMRVEVYF